MKRKNHLYENILKYENIEKAFSEVSKNTRNKRRVENMKEFKTTYINLVHDILEKKTYKVGPYNKFKVYEPKERDIVSQGVVDKIINHLVARYILQPALLPALDEVNVASRINKGTKAGLEYEQKYIRACNAKYKNNYYVLKCDIHHFFASIDKDVLKKKIERRIKDKDALEIVFKIIDSNDEGLYIGAMTNQVLAIFYLDDMDKFIREKLKIHYYVRYQDDFLLYNESKEYLQYCKKEIENFLAHEKLELNAKTRIFKGTNNYSFLGRDTSRKICAL